MPAATRGRRLPYISNSPSFMWLETSPLPWPSLMAGGMGVALSSSFHHEMSPSVVARSTTKPTIAAPTARLFCARVGFGSAADIVMAPGLSARGVSPKSRSGLIVSAILNHRDRTDPIQIAETVGSGPNDRMGRMPR